MLVPALPPEHRDPKRKISIWNLGREMSSPRFCFVSHLCSKEESNRDSGESTGPALLNCMALTEFPPSSSQLGLQPAGIPKKFNIEITALGSPAKLFLLQLSLDGAEQSQSCFPHKHPWNGISGIKVMRNTGNGNPLHQNRIKILCQLNNHIYA